MRSVEDMLRRSSTLWRSGLGCSARGALLQGRQIHIESWQLSTKPYGSLSVKLPFRCKVKISALDPHKCDWTNANVQLHIPTSSTLSEAQARALADQVGMKSYEDAEAGSMVRVECALQDETLVERSVAHHTPEVLIEVPGLHNVRVELKAGDLRLCDTIEGDVQIRTESAAIWINKLRSTSTQIETVEGDVEARIVQGDVSISSKSGKVRLKRAQGNELSIACGGGFEADSVYGGRIAVRTKGSLRIASVHGDAQIEAADAVICAVQGRLKMKSRGEVDLTLADSGGERVDVDAGGDVRVGVQKGIAAQFDLQAREVRDEDGALRNAQSSAPPTWSVRVATSGQVTLRDDGWAQRIAAGTGGT